MLTVPTHHKYQYKKIRNPISLHEGYVILVSATKIALEDISPITIVWLRFAMGVVILGIAVAARRQFSLPDKSEWGYFCLLAFLGITFHQWLQLVAVVVAAIILTEPITFASLLGGAVILLGVWMVNKN